MGFKTTNYVLKGIEFPKMYAIVKDYGVSNNRIMGAFNLHTTRENALTFEPLGKVDFSYPYDRNKSAFRQIYEQAKVEQFADWEDDIVSTELEETIENS